eukprot:TRINITY_DN1024_c0_g1_i1.p1 TRINITY_DN1024_c0_g1~~TRINITY_DN1024_c0_g1_i1.p1  ORF type:complete len:668 (+),score=81.95 TRINITY_DN1024_c0_g1_i1:114-2006(+)
MKHTLRCGFSEADGIRNVYLFFGDLLCHVLADIQRTVWNSRFPAGRCSGCMFSRLLCSDRVSLSLTVPICRFSGSSSKNVPIATFGDPSSTLQTPTYLRSRTKDWNYQREFFDILGKRLGITSHEDWYNITIAEAYKAGGESILKHHFGNSLARALTTVYPEHPWRYTFNTRAPANHFADVSVQRQFFEQIRPALRVEKWQDWYQVTWEAITEQGGRAILNRYGNSHIKALMSIYPELPWRTMDFAHVPRKHWEDPEHHREFFDRLGEELGVKEWHDWYSIQPKVIKKRGGNPVLNFYGGSHMKALMKIYPKHPWEFKRFAGVIPDGFWANLSNQRDFFDYLADRLGIQHWHDWYQVTYDVVLSHGGVSIFSHVPANESSAHLYTVLKNVYPEHNWKEEEFSWLKRRAQQPRTSKTQQFLFQKIARLFPSDVPHMNYIVTTRSDSDPPPPSEFPVPSNFTPPNEIGQVPLPGDDLFDPLAVSSKTVRDDLEVDIAIPSLLLAFEYQGEQHYADAKIFGTAAQRGGRDKFKLDVVEKSGYSLLQIPFWWDRQDESLLATILSKRPELVARLAHNLYKSISFLVRDESTMELRVNSKADLFKVAIPEKRPDKARRWQLQKKPFESSDPNIPT